MSKGSNKDNIIRTENGTYIVRMSYFYTEYLGDPYVEVTEDVLNALIEMKRDEKKLEMRDYRHLSPLMFDEAEAGELYGHYSVSAEEEYLAELGTSNLISCIKRLEPTFRRRFCMYHIYGMTIDEIAEIENVSRPAVIKSIRKAEALLRNSIKNTENTT